MTTHILIEGLNLEEAVIDREKRTVTQVLIRAGTSKNNRRYPEAVLQEATALFEGVKTYANHPTATDRKERPERDVRHLTGWISDVRYDSGKLVGTRHFLSTEAGKDVWAVVEDIIEKRAPSHLMGGSINAIGQAKKIKENNTDITEVEKIVEVYSVDDVTTPAAGGGFIESAGRDLTQALLEALSFEEWFETRPDFVARLQKEMKAIRQDDAVKAAKAEADHNRNALQEAMSRIESLEAERDAALQNTDATRRALTIEQLLSKTPGFNQTWRESIRKQLQDASPEKWDAILETELKKAKSGGKPAIPVTGADAQVDTPPERNQFREADVRPRDNEDVDSWQRRMAKLKRG